MGTFIDLSGQVFGDLVVIDQAQNRGSLVQWNCKCKCGQMTTATTKKLRNGRKRSCGCLWLPAVVAAKTKHGHSSGGEITTELRIWMNLRSRCNCKDNPSYGRYGGRGISVCARWDDFSAFLADMGPRPSMKHSIDRIDNNGNYEPSNCRWATTQEQSRNRSSNVLVDFNGTLMCLGEAAEKAGLDPGTIRYRMRKGWPESKWFSPTAN